VVSDGERGGNEKVNGFVLQKETTVCHLNAEIGYCFYLAILAANINASASH